MKIKPLHVKYRYMTSILINFKENVSSLVDGNTLATSSSLKWLLMGLP